jgi:hypothetical protein
VAWLIGAMVAASVFLVLARRRRDRVAVSPADPVSTLNSELSRRTSKGKKSALDAATRLLR